MPLWLHSAHTKCVKIVITIMVMVMLMIIVVVIVSTQKGDVDVYNGGDLNVNAW